MGMLLAFAPFIAFAALHHFVGATEGLIAGAATSAALLLRDWATPGRSPKILEIGTAILFVALTLYSIFGDPAWSIVGVRLCVDLGLLLIVLASIALRQPFTLQYAREQTPAEVWSRPEFVRANYVITGVWGLAFIVFVIADLLLLYAPSLPPRVGILATVAAFVAAIKFTGWYPERMKARQAR